MDDDQWFVARDDGNWRRSTAAQEYARNQDWLDQLIAAKDAIREAIDAHRNRAKEHRRARLIELNEEADAMQTSVDE